MARCLTQVFTEHSSMLGYVPSAGKQPTIQWMVDGKCLGYFKLMVMKGLTAESSEEVRPEEVREEPYGIWGRMF